MNRLVPTAMRSRATLLQARATMNARKPYVTMLNVAWLLGKEKRCAPSYIKAGRGRRMTNFSVTMKSEPNGRHPVKSASQPSLPYEPGTDDDNDRKGDRGMLT